MGVDEVRWPVDSIAGRSHSDGSPDALYAMHLPEAGIAHTPGGNRCASIAFFSNQTIGLAGTEILVRYGVLNPAKSCRSCRESSSGSGYRGPHKPQAGAHKSLESDTASLRRRAVTWNNLRSKRGAATVFDATQSASLNPVSRSTWLLIPYHHRPPVGHATMHRYGASEPERAPDSRWILLLGRLFLH